ncbi:MAG: MFS transporter [Halobacteriales archaeon]|nr:MFS transporter [Halobacteriales archaeon]
MSDDRRIIGVTTVSHATVHTYELSIPILMVVWLAEFDVSPAVLGVVVGAGYALFGIGALPGGVLADKIGSRPLILFCLVGMSGGFIAMSLIPGLVGVTVGLLVWGAAASVYHPAGLSLISRGVEKRGRALGYHGAAGNVGIGFGPFVTAVLLVFVDWRVVAALLALPALVVAVFTLRLGFEEPAVADGGETGAGFVRESRALFASAFAVAFVVAMASGLYYRGILTFLPEILGDVIAFDPGFGFDFEASRYVYSALLAVGVAGQYTGGRLAEKNTELRMALGYGMLAVIALAFILVLDAPVALVVVSLVLGFFLFVVQPLYQNTIARHTPENARGVSYGYTYLGVFGIGALGATIAGAVLTYSTEGVLFVVLALIAALGSGAAAYLVVTDRD